MARLPELAAEGEAVAAEAAWYRGDRGELDARLDRARELVEPLPDSRAKAWILSQAARYAMLGGAYSEAIEYARSALAMTHSLELSDVRIGVLNNLGSARVRSGDLDGIADLEASAALAEELNSPELARSVNNLGSIMYSRGRVRECSALEHRALEVAERFGLASMVMFARGNVLGSYYRLGQWDELTVRIEELLADDPPAGPEAAARALRAWVRAARGDLTGAQEDSEFDLEHARRANEPQALYPALATHAYVLDAAGDVEGCRKVVLESVERLEQVFPRASSRPPARSSTSGRAPSAPSGWSRR